MPKMADHDELENEAPTANEDTTPDRRQAERRGIDRRAFWRPTPDRRREANEDGRRTTDK